MIHYLHVSEPSDISHVAWTLKLSHFLALEQMAERVCVSMCIIYLGY